MPVAQAFEATLAAPFTVSGRGLHTNRPARVTVEPAPPGHGIVFAPVGAGPVALSWENRAPSRLNTALALSDGSRLRTVEHLAASLSAFRIDNALVRVEGRELPIFDGSARAWCTALHAAGRREQAAARRHIRILRPLQIVLNARFVRAEPADALALDVTGAAYYGGGAQAWRGWPDRAVFEAELAGSRSSGQVDRLWSGPVARRLLAPLLRPVFPRRDDGASTGPPINTPVNAPLPDLPNALTGDLIARMRNPGGEPVLRGLRPGRAAIHLGPYVLGGARFPDERVRHNALDFLGDLMLAGGPLLGRFVAHRPTHKLTYAFVAALMQDRNAWAIATT